MAPLHCALIARLQLGHQVGQIPDMDNLRIKLQPQPQRLLPLAPVLLHHLLILLVFILIDSGPFSHRQNAHSEHPIRPNKYHLHHRFLPLLALEPVQVAHRQLELRLLDYRFLLSGEEVTRDLLV